MRPWATDSHTPSRAPLARGYNCQAAMPLFKTANWLFHLSHPSTLFSQPFLCLPLFAEQIGEVAQRAEGVAESLRSSENHTIILFTFLPQLRYHRFYFCQHYRLHLQHCPILETQNPDTKFRKTHKTFHIIASSIVPFVRNDLRSVISSGLFLHLSFIVPQF